MARKTAMAAKRKFGTQSQYAYEMIRRWILRGRMLAGERIVIDRLADQLDMSRIPVRDALRELVAEHLVVRVGSRGWAVASFSIEELDSACAIRVALEVEAARRCALRATPEEIASLRETAQKVDAYWIGPRRDEAHEYDWEMHLEIARIGGGDKMREQLRLWLVVLLEPREAALEEEEEEDDGEGGHGHIDVIDAIATGDPDVAEKIMRSHVEATEYARATRLLQDGIQGAPDAP